MYHWSHVKSVIFVSPNLIQFFLNEIMLSLCMSHLIHAVKIREVPEVPRVVVLLHYIKDIIIWPLKTIKWSIHNNYSFVCHCPPLPHLLSSALLQRSEPPPCHAAITVIVQTWGRFIKGIISVLCAILYYYCSLDKWLRKHVWVSMHCSLDDEWRIVQTKLYINKP